MAETAEKDDANPMLEEGDIFFAYRPRVQNPNSEGEPDAEGPRDVQNFYLILKPRGGAFRLINIGRDRLPDLGKHERHWGFVDMVAKTGKELEEALQADSYETKTRGERERPAVQPAGEGVYAIVKEGRQMHLAWVLELPEQPGPVQKAFKIAPEASLAISIKNPEKPSGPGRPEAGEEPDYPKQLQDVFRDRKFATEDPRLLDYEGAQVIFVGARADPTRAYHLDLEPEDEDPGHADLFTKLHFAKSRHPVEPLFEGTWT